MRQIVLDTETTGLEVSQGHRIIEIGCIELLNRRVSGSNWHYYFNPEREVDSGAFDVHGISSEFLQDKPRFAELADDFYSYIAGAELVIHNAAFDVGFLNQELARLEQPFAPLAEACSILDTLLLARQKHPGQKNNLDALCKRYGIDNSHRSLHGALLDARILADVYLVMTGGQTSLGLDSEQGNDNSSEQLEVQRIDPGQPLPLWQLDELSQQANCEYIEFLATQHDDPAWK
ncbi:MAG: DNA polymerase III subunit epsilon [Gammaproteobacteria bacterium]|nr:DNA polymerase III subunit epsilon [Gammaproteobacteria bacterium]